MFMRSLGPLFGVTLKSRTLWMHIVGTAEKDLRGSEPVFCHEGLQNLRVRSTRTWTMWASAFGILIMVSGRYLLLGYIV